MKFKELIDRCNRENVLNALVKIYPDQLHLKDTYGLIIDKLKLMKPAVPGSELILSVSRVEDEDESWYDVDGYSPIEGVSYGIEFTPFNEWLSMEVSNENLKELGEEAFIAHCLWEMTFISFDENEIRDQFEMLKKEIESIENGTAELVEFNPDSTYKDD